MKLLSHNGLFVCPLAYCENESYRIKRGCRKHVFTKLGWYYYFEWKPDIGKAFPNFSTSTNNCQLPSRVKTSNMPMFLKTCVVGMNFKEWLQNPVVEEKKNVRHISYFAKFWHTAVHVSISLDNPENVVGYCLGSVTMICDFVKYLQTD